MSQANELLDSLTDEELDLYSADPESEPHIVVGKDRVIKVPDELKRIAVQYDHNVETVTFDCPRYWDEHDLSTMVVYINYMLPDNTPGCYIAKNVRAEGDIMHFDWTIKREITQIKGNISFLICINKTDADGNEENHWNSELNRELYISEGLENCKEVVLNQYPDVVTDLLTRMTSVEAVKPLVDAAVININEAKTEVLEAHTSVKRAEINVIGIQNNVNEKAAEIRDSYANAIKNTKTGEIVRIDDVSPVEHNVKCRVKSKNLFNALKVSTTPVKNDFAYISTVDVGTVVVYSNEVDNGYCSSGIRLREICGDIPTNVNYTLTAVSASKSRTYIYLNGAEVRWDFGATKMLTEAMLDSTVVFYGYEDAEGDGDCVISNIQLELGDTATEYTPHVDPSTVTVTRYGKNMLGVENREIVNFGGTSESPRTFTGNGIILGLTHNNYYIPYNVSNYTLTDELIRFTASQVGYGMGLDYITRPNTTYYISANERINDNCVIAEYGEDGSYLRARNVVDNVYTTSEDTYYFVMCLRRTANSEDTTSFTNLQVEVMGVSEYEKSKEKHIYTPGTDGAVTVKSVSPTMTLMTNTPGVTIECEYNRDTTAYLKEIKDSVAASNVTTMVDTVTGLLYSLNVVDGKLILTKQEV